MRLLALRLHAEACSCVIATRDGLQLCHDRGVSDLYRMYCRPDHPLDGALIADKVVGKGAAALMVAGGVKGVYADVVSRPALELLTDSGVRVVRETITPNIINRAGTGICPVEKLCADCRTARECLPLIADFLTHPKS